MKNTFSIHIDKQCNKQFVGYRVRVANNSYPNMGKTLNRRFKTRKEAEQYELDCYRLLQFIKGEL